MSGHRQCFTFATPSLHLRYNTAISPFPDRACSRGNGKNKKKPIIRRRSTDNGLVYYPHRSKDILPCIIGYFDVYPICCLLLILLDACRSIAEIHCCLLTDKRPEIGNVLRYNTAILLFISIYSEPLIEQV